MPARLKPLTTEEMRQFLREKLPNEGVRETFAKGAGVQDAYVKKVLYDAEKQIPTWLAQAFGYSRRKVAVGEYEFERSAKK